MSHQIFLHLADAEEYGVIMQVELKCTESYRFVTSAKNTINVFGFIFLFSSSLAVANINSSVSIGSNYLFNGITLTEDKMAFQPSLDWSSEDGFYIGTWASNVSFTPNTDFEVDGYIGFYTDVSTEWALDLGVAQYTYYGSNESHEFNYPEAYIKVSYADTKISYWYAENYFGAGGGHYTIMLTHDFQLTDSIILSISADRSTSTDTTKFLRDNDGTYNHWKVALLSNWNGFKWTVAIDDTDLESENLGKQTFSILATKTFNLF